jgi:deazaflavin-dependent oxidoreductase (nitroreductase family)
VARVSEIGGRSVRAASPQAVTFVELFFDLVFVFAITQITAILEVRGRASGQPRSTPVVIATVEGSRYLVSMLGPGSDWVKNVEAANGDAVLRQGRRRPVHLVAVPPAERAPILADYVRVATSGRHHLPVAVGAPLSEFEAIAERYPVYRIDPR